MNKYKTFEELKEELGDKFEDYMYKANIELLTKIDKAIEKINNLIEIEKGMGDYERFFGNPDYEIKKLNDIKDTLQGENKDE